MKMKTSSELKRLKTNHGIGKKLTKMSSAKMISAKLQKLRQSMDLKTKLLNQSNSNQYVGSGLKLFRTDKLQQSSQKQQTTRFTELTTNETDP